MDKSWILSLISQVPARAQFFFEVAVFKLDVHARIMVQPQRPGQILSIDIQANALLAAPAHLMEGGVQQSQSQTPLAPWAADA